jgi:DUF2075 family protein
MTDFRLEAFPFTGEAVRVWAESDELNADWPVVYTINNDQEIYVGETVNAASRMHQHLGVAERKNLKSVQIIKNSRFNKSACLDLESQLIRYFAADNKYKVLNGNLGITESNYFDREKYRESFKEVFELLYQKGYLTRPIPEIVNSDLFKYSPFKSLNTEQAVALTGIMERLFNVMDSNRDDEIVIQGDPGTGKTIVAIYLVKLLSDIGRFLPDEISSQDSIFSEYFTDKNRERMANLRIGFVIPQQSLRKTVQKVFASIPGLNKAMVMSQFEVGSSPVDFDLLVVDETHRLGQRANQSSAAQNIQFREINEKLFGMDDPKWTQLDWIRAKSNKRILLVDAQQSVKPGDLPQSVLSTLQDAAIVRDAYFQLSSQMRVEGGNDYVEFVGSLFSEEPMKSKGFGKYDLQFFESFKDMLTALTSKEREVGLSRIVAGYAWDWVSKKDKTRHDIEIEGFKLFWNRTSVDWINSKTSAEEVGGIHTVQGYDLNYAGVIIGADLKFDPESQKIVFDRSSYFDTKGKENNDALGFKYSDEDILQFVVNIYRVLMTRGIRGTYVYVVDPALRNHLSKFF